MVPTLAWAIAPATTPSTQPSIVESKPVEKDGVSVRVSLKQQAISVDEQPQFTVRFSNTSADYINLYDVEAFGDWQILFTNTDKEAEQPGPCLLRLNKIPNRYPFAHKQIKPGESTEVMVNLSDPPFTFEFVYEGSVDGHRVAPLRHLGPGTYRMTITITLRNPFGPGYHEWMGPLTTEPVELNVLRAGPNRKREPTSQEIAAYGDAIHRVTEKLQEGGLWLNGGFPEIKLPKEAKSEDVIDAAVNQTSLDSKAYRVLKVQPFSRGRMPQTVSGSAVLLQVGKTYKVVIIFPFEGFGWWTRFYDTEISTPTSH